MGQNVILTASGATGGSGNYTYQWLEKVPGSGWADAGSCFQSNLTYYDFFSQCGGVTGTYLFKLRVTDNATLEATNSTTVSVVVTNVEPQSVSSVSQNQTVPNYADYYVPITLHNNQSGATPASFQQMSE